jgi:hypothetical protein
LICLPKLKSIFSSCKERKKPTTKPLRVFFAVTREIQVKSACPAFTPILGSGDEGSAFIAGFFRGANVLPGS